jgi:long-chain fatty acid transport protein
MNRTLQAAIGVILATGATQLHAAGFYLKEQSIVSQGQAFAGVAAQSGLASSTYFNPAGLATLDVTTVEGGTHLILTDQKVKDNGSTGGDVTANTTEQSPLDDVIVIPNLYWAMPLEEGSVLGVGVSAPFGSSNEYQADYFGKYNHVKADLKTVDLTVAIGKQINENLRLGGSLYYQKLDVEQVKASTIGGTATLKGDAADIGYSFGLQYSAGKTTWGLSHRSGTTQDITGSNIVSGSLLEISVDGSYTTSATMKLPAITSLGVEHQFSEETDLYLGITHYSWSVYDKLVVVTPDLAIARTATTNNNYNDTTSFSIGVNHHYRSDLELRAGFHYDPTPTNDTDRSFSTPDGDRTWLTFGASKTVDPSLTLGRHSAG